MSEREDYLIRAETKEFRSKTRVCSWDMETKIARIIASKRSEVVKRVMVSKGIHCLQWADKDGIVNGNAEKMDEGEFVEAVG